MKIVSAATLTVQAFVETLKYSPLVIAPAVISEGVQHIVEWQLGMFESKAEFQAHSSDSLRLAFGVVKAAAVLITFYFVSKGLFRKNGPVPRYGSFNKDLLRKLWDPRGSTLGLITMASFVLPLIFVHYQLNFLALGTPLAPVLLAVDSIIVGLIALAMPCSYWASASAEANTGSIETTSLH